MDLPKPNDAQDGFTVFHTLWTAAITVAGAIVAFFTKRLVDQVDSKADQSDVDDLKQNMRDFLSREERERIRQDSQHAQNTLRLDTIILELANRK